MPAAARAATSVAGGEIELSFRVIALLAVFGQVQTRGFNFLGGAQTDHGLHDVGYDDGAHNGEHQSYSDGLNLFDPKAAVGNEFSQSVRLSRSPGICDVGITALGGSE